MVKRMRSDPTIFSMKKHNHACVKFAVSFLLVGLAFRLLLWDSFSLSSVVKTSPHIAEEKAECTVFPFPLEVSDSVDVPGSNQSQTSQNEKCDILVGEWVPDQSGPMYTNESCHEIENHQNCMKNGRPDSGYLYWRWSPRDCEIPKFLLLMRDKSWAFIGDFISRNHVHSLLCILSQVKESQILQESILNSIIDYSIHNTTNEQSNMNRVSVSKSEEKGEPILCSYASWLGKHPSALNNFEEVMNIAKGKEIVVFLDYDGTLSPIVDDPDQAYMSEAMRAVVNQVASSFPTAIVSGRRREKVFEFVKLKNVYYAGSHGMDISTPLGSSKYEDQEHQIEAVDDKGNQVVNFHPARDFLPAIQEIIKVLKENITSINGSMVEDNTFCVSVHYRRVKNEEDVGVLKEIVESIMKAYPNFRISRGKKVMEIRPNISWDKGHALMYLLNTLGFDNYKDVLPIYIGDDKTDEDAFKVIRQIGQGFPIIVSSIAKETKASYSLRDPADVMTFLKRLARWKKKLLQNN